MLIAQPAWTARDREILTQFIFEKFKTPAFCLLDSAVAVCYAYGTANATVIDVGYEKAEVTAVTDFTAIEHGRGIALSGCGGEAMTERLLELLRPKGFTREMCEQLKKSNICEILPAGTPLPKSDMEHEPTKSIAPSAPGKGPDMARNVVGGEAEDDEEVLDVAAIVVSGNASEYLAKKEREKAEKAAARKAHGDAAAAAKLTRLPNSKKEKATFQFQEYKPVEAKDENNQITTQYVLHKRDIEVGTERFLAATPSEARASEQGFYGILEKLAAQIDHTIHSIPAPSKRSELWDSMIILGSGSKIRGQFFHLLIRSKPGLILISHYRIPTSPRLHNNPKIRPIALRHNVHLRNPLRPLHPHAHRWNHHTRPTTQSRPQPRFRSLLQRRRRRRRRRPRRKPPPRRRHTRKRYPSTTHPPPPQHANANANADAEPHGPVLHPPLDGALPNTYIRQTAQTTRIFSRMERPGK